MDRSFPPPSFPTSLQVFYKSPPLNFKETETKSCMQEDSRNFISRQVILKRRFPRLEVLPENSSSSPVKKQGIMQTTDQFQHRTRSISPIDRFKAFVPCGRYQAKEISTRKASIFEGNPYDDPKELAFKEYKEDVKKRIDGDFRRAMKEQNLHDAKSYLNSLNTFEMFSSVTSEGRTRNSVSLFKN